jgi:two-component system, sensor histidine kinase
LIEITPELARSALDAAPDAMVIIDQGGVIRFVNRQVSLLFGYTPEGILGKGIEVLLPDRFRGQHVAHRARYFREGGMREMGAGIALYARRRDGTEFPVEISLSHIGTERRPLVAAAIRDASERRRAAAELNAARESADAARQLADVARDTADRASQSKSRFLATASHDLRQPLQTLALLNGTLRRVVTDPDAAQALEQQEQAIGTMSVLLNTLLDISKLESGAISPQTRDFELAELFANLEKEFAVQAVHKGLRFEIEPCRQLVRSDPALVGQILRNLISNAIKYTNKGRVCVRCLCESGLARIDVQDTGIGIATEQLPHICSEFYQVGIPANASREGYGLGLSIAQRLVNLLMLKLDIRSELDNGSTFSLSLPAIDGAPAGGYATSPGTMARPERPVGQVRVLLVEDDEGVRRATRMLLRVEGYAVTAVASLAEALQHVSAGNALDLLISDYHLAGGVTGIHAVSALREATGVPLKAVIVTGDTSAAIKELPRDPFLRVASKPIQADALMALLRGLLAA